MFLTLWNVYKFHADYAFLDGFDPGNEDTFIPLEERVILTDGFYRRLHPWRRNIMINSFDGTFIKLEEILRHSRSNDLSNWYVRRSRRRLWNEVDSIDKHSCQNTLHEVLLIACRLMAPVSPFVSDAIHRADWVFYSLADWPVGSDIIEVPFLQLIHGRNGNGVS